MEKLEDNGRTLEIFFRNSAVLGIIGVLAAGIFLAATELSYLYITVLLFAAFFSTTTLAYFLELYFFEKSKREKESAVPDMLLQASAFPKGLAIEKMLLFFSNAEFGKLGKEFETALSEIRKGTEFPEAMGNIKKRCKSGIIGRAVGLIVRGYESGSDLGDVFRHSAEDFFETNSLLRERNAALIIEKYTLLFAGGLIVPAVLGLLIGMVSGIDFSGLQELELGIAEESKTGLLETIVFANQIYIAEYAVIAGIFLASQEGNPKKALLYAMLLLPVSFGINFLAKTAFMQGF